MFIMDFHRSLIFSICVFWCLFETGLAKNEGSQESQTLLRRLRRKYDCITDFKLEEIDSDDQKMKFSWRGPKGYHNGVNYNLNCARLRDFFDSYKPFSCSGSESNIFPKQTDTERYFPGSEYYCTVKTSIFERRRSNIITVSTPGQSFKTPTPIIIAVSVFCVFIVFYVIRRIYYYNKRKIPVTGVVVTESTPRPPPPNASQYAYHYGQMQNPSSHRTAAQTQPCFQEIPLDNPPPYTAINYK